MMVVWNSRFETSAKENKNIDEAAKLLVQKILENHIEQQKSADDNTITLEANAPKPEQKPAAASGGCC